MNSVSVDDTPLLNKHNVKNEINTQADTAKRTREQIKILNHYYLACQSREASLLTRREVLTGKAKFGITGDGKELPQIALSQVFQHGDFRSGYYRDQTWMLALNIVSIEQLFAQLYADPNREREPHSGGRQMNSHFATASIDQNGNWNDLTQQYNASADVSCTAGQMSRAVGLAMASRKFRNIKELHNFSQFSKNGNEVTFVSIGDASTSEGIFWEALNTAGVWQIPMVVSIWDDGYGISVPKKYQTTKSDIGLITKGFEYDEDLGSGIKVFKVKGYDYPALLATYQKAANLARTKHIPVLVHVEDLTQPQGHSTSGSHERYKTQERLNWEKQYDGIVKFGDWIVSEGIATQEELLKMRKEAQKSVKEAQRKAWKAFNAPIKEAIKQLQDIYDNLIENGLDRNIIVEFRNELSTLLNPTRREVAQNARQVLAKLRKEPPYLLQELKDWTQNFQEINQEKYSAFLHSKSNQSALNVKEVKAVYTTESKIVNGYEALNKCFDAAFAKYPQLLAFGEDVGYIGDVNQGMAGLQQKYGIERIYDTGIRENVIIGQGIGMAMRGLRPIAEIQYLDYFLYGLQPVADDLASLHYRCAGKQKAPLIIRTRGHRLEGIWHSGSPIAMILNSVRGVYLITPRNMVQAAGFYNSMLQSDDPAIIIECLNGYRLKERLPENIDTFTIPLGVPEIWQEGEDITIVTYGSCCRIVQEAADRLAEVGISCELVDARTLLPFDLQGIIGKSLQKTNRILFVDEDVPGGATAYMLQQVIEKQNGYQWLDAAPATLTAKAHRPAYGSDGDYYCKPNTEDVFEKVYSIMHELNPETHPNYLW